MEHFKSNYSSSICAFRYDAKRVIVRQGHPASSFYFILSGSGLFITAYYMIFALRAKASGIYWQE